MLKCRPIINNTYVFFNSCGKDENGHAIRYRDDNNSSFAENEEGVVQSLSQRLSIIKEELWYNTRYGIPLFDKMKSKVEADIAVASMIELHPDVKNIDDFTSQIIGKRYSCNVIINTKEGPLSIQI